MTKPTYEELNSIDMDAKAIANQNPIGTLFAWRKAYLAALADAVLAKWGAPQAGVGAACQHEWVGFARTSMPPKYACRKCHAFFDSPPTTTPQPTQAQAKAVSLTDEQWQRIADLTGGRILTQTVKDEIERVIGIKRDQHDL